jgi:hypothetical protein
LHAPTPPGVAPPPSPPCAAAAPESRPRSARGGARLGSAQLVAMAATVLAPGPGSPFPASRPRMAGHGAVAPARPQLTCPCPVRSPRPVPCSACSPARSCVTRLGAAWPWRGHGARPRRGAARSPPPDPDAPSHSGSPAPAACPRLPGAALCPARRPPVHGAASVVRAEPRRSPCSARFPRRARRTRGSPAPAWCLASPLRSVAPARLRLARSWCPCVARRVRSSAPACARRVSVALRVRARVVRAVP